MKLELKHLAPYLPYCLNIYINDLRDHVNNFTLELYKDISLKDVIDNENKPILRPLSYLTKQIEHNGEKFLLIDFLLDKDIIVYNPNIDYRLLRFGDIEKLLKHHFDVFGLIDKGLAIDINTL